MPQEPIAVKAACIDTSPPKVDRVERLNAKPPDLPADAVYKGYRSVYQKEIRIVRDYVEYQIGRWYSASEHKYYESAYPSSYGGAIGSTLQSFIQILHHCGDMTHRKIGELLGHLGINLSGGSISNILTQSDWILGEQADLLKASLAHSPYHQIDSTMSKQKGQRMHTQIICGKYFSLFYTQMSKSRLDVYAALQGQSRAHIQLAYNAATVRQLEQAKVSLKHREYFKDHFSEAQILALDQLEQIFDTEDLFKKTNPSRRSMIAGAFAAGFYAQQEQIPRVKHLISDDASEYKGIAQNKHHLCWVHAIRHYRILHPTDPYLRSVYEAFMRKLWDFYARMKTYGELPAKHTEAEKKQIIREFDQLFGKKTDYQKLNKQMGITKKNKPQLLAFLEKPEVPLHNNNAERGARRVVRKRDISFHTWSEKGTRIRDAFMSMHQTAKKLNISFMDYLKDRNDKQYKITSLAQQLINAYQ